MTEGTVGGLATDPIKDTAASTSAAARTSGLGGDGSTAFDGVSIVIPAFNEGPHVAAEVRRVREVLDALGLPNEVIVVDDGSTDETAEEAEKEATRVIRAGRNRGYGVSLKTGIRAAKYPWVGITDADGTYPAAHFKELLEASRTADMVVGARRGVARSIPLIRRPPKWLLRKLASYLCERPIPDLNSGMRIIRKSLVRRYEYLLPDGFSFTTTITMASIVGGFDVSYVPIEYLARKGRSKIRPRHAFDFFVLILRIAVFFNPLRLFLPLGGILALGGAVKFAIDVWIGNLSETAVLGFLGALIIWAVGLLADQNMRIAQAIQASREPQLDE